MHDPLIAVKNVHYSYQSGRTKIRAVDGVSFALDKGEALGIVGESGSGKTTLAKMTAGLIKPENGRILYSKKEIGMTVHPRVQYVFQNTAASLDPCMNVEAIIAEGLVSRDLRGQNKKELVLYAAKAVGLSRELFTRIPGQLSGGQQQRVALARTLVADPSVMVLDEPVSSLDVTAGARLLALLAKLRSYHGLSYIFVAHDLAVVSHICDRVLVMYAGKLAEAGPVHDVFVNPAHYYTKLLLAVHPSPDPQQRPGIKIPEGTFDPAQIPSGCRFHPRCPAAKEVCRVKPPAFVYKNSHHKAACHFA